MVVAPFAIFKNYFDIMDLKDQNFSEYMENFSKTLDNIIFEFLNDLFSIELNFEESGTVDFYQDFN